MYIEIGAAEATPVPSRRQRRQREQQQRRRRKRLDEQAVQINE